MTAEQIIIHVTQLVAFGGAAGIGGVLLLNSAGLPISSEIVLPLAGVAVARGELGWAEVVAWCVIGQIIGFVIAYWIARLAGLELVERFGRYFLLSHDRIVAIQRRFQRHGSALVFIGACLPGVHGSVGMSAGLAKLPFAPYLTLMSLGTLIYTVVLLVAGYVFGDALPRLVAGSGGLVTAVVVIVALAFGAVWYSRHRFGVHPPTTGQASSNRKRP